MNKLLNNFVIVVATASVCWATLSPVSQCKNEKIEGLEERIKINSCDANKCKLRRETNVTVDFRFIPKKEVMTLENEVFAEIYGISLEFIGTSGTSACGHVRFAANGEPADCPLEPGKEYLYSYTFYIYPFYPTMKDFTVRWSLKDGDQNVICFKVPADIVKAKNKKKVD